jgi:mono/diheme cytochrome c family protein
MWGAIAASHASGANGRERTSKTMKRFEKKTSVLAVAILAALAGTGMSQRPTPATGVATTNTESVYAAKCAMCHGADGSGDTAMGKRDKLRDLRSAEVQAQSDEQLFEITAKGKGKMPGYAGKLTDDQIRAVVGEIRAMAAKGSAGNTKGNSNTKST